MDGKLLKQQGVPEEGDEEPRVGARIKELRRQKGMSLQDLALRSGVSAGMISHIERDLANPSLRTLTRIRLALQVPLSALFETAPDGRQDPDFVRRASKRPRLDLGPRYVVKELLSSSVAQNLQFMILTIPPGGGSGSAPLRYSAEKAGLVLEGEILLKVDDVEVPLREGDSFQFDSLLPHSFRNDSDAPARVLWIIGQTLPDRHL